VYNINHHTPNVKNGVAHKGILTRLWRYARGRKSNEEAEKAIQHMGYLRLAFGNILDILREIDG